MSIGLRMRELRVDAGLTQKDISERSGVAVSYLSRIENDRINPSVPTLHKIARALEHPIESLFGGMPQKHHNEPCPVSVSGNCIMEKLQAKRRAPPIRGERYTPEHLEALRMCSYLMHTEDEALISAMTTMMKSLLDVARRLETGDGRGDIGNQAS